MVRAAVAEAQPVASCWTAVQEGRAHPDDWFPENARGMDRWNKAALAMCTECPLRIECLHWALRKMSVGPVDGVPGIWGGTTQNQRIKILRRRYGL